MSPSSNDIDSESLSPEALDYEYLNGRRYHGFRAGQYLLPNDEKEQARMDLLHAIWYVTYSSHDTVMLIALI